MNAKERLDEALESAEEVFWHKIAELYPEAKGGDLDPYILVRFQLMAEEAVKAWLTLNIWEEANDER